MEISVWKLFLAGGPMMWPLLLCALVAATIIVGKVIFFLSGKHDPFVFKRELHQAVRKNDLRQAVLLCEASGSLGKVFRAGLLKFGRPREEIVTSMEEEARVESLQFEEGVSLLSMIGNIAPLLGLLGTVLGLASAFRAVQLRSEAMNPAMVMDMAEGLWQALIVSAAGLLVAIPIFIAVGVFSDYIRRRVVEMEKFSRDFVDFLIGISETSTASGEDV